MLYLVFDLPRSWPLGLLLACASVLAAEAGPRIVIDTRSSTLVVLQAGQPLLELEGIAIGRFGTTPYKRRGDRMTPLGSYRIAWIKHGGEFRSFLGIDYPSVADAERGLRAGLISAAEHRAILAAHQRGDLPPQDTALGGYLGIHGLGEADPEIHAAYNWTKGCVAVTDRQLAQLLRWVEVGTAVEIR